MSELFFGTPLSPNALKVMLLGSGELGKEVVIALQRLGVETIAVDRYANAPAMQVAHRSHVIAMTDAAALRALVESERPHLIVPEIEAIATDELARIEADGLAEVIPTARAAQLTMNREGIRRLAAETLGLPTSPYKFCDSLAELQAAIDGENGQGVGYPCIVKPVMSSSGKGQSKIDGPADVPKAWDYAMAGGRVSHGRVIVEGFIDFDYEITLLTVRTTGTTGPAVHFCEPIGHRRDNGGPLELWQPHQLTESALDAARSIAARIAGKLGGTGLFTVDLLLGTDAESGAEEVYFATVHPMLTGAGFVTTRSQRLSQFDLHARAILGLPVDTIMISPAAGQVSRPSSDKAAVARALADALAVAESDVRLSGEVCVALATAPDVVRARDRAHQVATVLHQTAASNQTGK